jgi:hypothetical protein
VLLTDPVFTLESLAPCIANEHNLFRPRNLSSDISRLLYEKK